MVTKHRLKIDSLRDLHAHCTCGGWSMSYTTTSRDTSAELRSHAYESFRRHLHGLIATCTKLVDPLPVRRCDR